MSETAVVILVAGVVLAVALGYEIMRLRYTLERVKEVHMHDRQFWIKQAEDYKGSSEYWRRAWDELRVEAQEQRKQLMEENRKIQSMLADARNSGFEPGVSSLFDENESYSIRDYEAEEVRRRQLERGSAELAEEVRARLADVPEEIQPPEEYPEP